MSYPRSLDAAITIPPFPRYASDRTPLTQVAHQTSFHLETNYLNRCLPGRHFLCHNVLAYNAKGNSTGRKSAENQKRRLSGYSDEVVRPWASAYLVSSAVVWRPSCSINFDL